MAAENRRARRIDDPINFSKGGETNVRLGCSFSHNRVDSSSLGVWRNRRGIGRNCEVAIRFVPCDVCDFFLSRPARRKKDSVTYTAAFWTISRACARDLIKPGIWMRAVNV